MDNIKNLLKASGSPDKPEMSRRDFLGWIIKGGLLTTLIGMIAPALTYVWPVTRQGPSSGMKEIGGVEEIPVGGAKKVIVGGSAMLILHTAKGFKAFSAICTHLGCLVAWDEKKQEIVCPCHAGIFDKEGRVVSGPPPKSLPEYAVNVVNGKVLVKI